MKWLFKKIKAWWLKRKRKPLVELKCEQCKKEKVVMFILFCSKTNPSHIYVCNVCAKDIFEQYKKMGKPGQISIIPTDRFIV